ncbi:unnamed protein product, partial [Brassica rapa subsp. trilocularis]
LVVILTFVPTKVAVSTSILSKRWESLWTWVPKLEFVDIKYGSDTAIKDFINKNLPLLKSPVIQSFLLQCPSTFPLEDIKFFRKYLKSSSLIYSTKKFIFFYTFFF